MATDRIDALREELNRWGQYTYQHYTDGPRQASEDVAFLLKIYETERGNAIKSLSNLERDNAKLLAEVERLRAREAALMEIVEAVAKVKPYYSEQPEGFFCVMCDGWEPEAYRPYNAEERFKHDADCPVTKDRALLAPGAAEGEGE